jgi:hypothetical protein
MVRASCGGFERVPVVVLLSSYTLPGIHTYQHTEKNEHRCLSEKKTHLTFEVYRDSTPPSPWLKKISVNIVIVAFGYMFISICSASVISNCSSVSRWQTYNKRRETHSNDSHWASISIARPPIFQIVLLFANRTLRLHENMWSTH